MKDEEIELEEIRSFDQRFYLKRGDKKDIIFHDNEECFSLPPGLPSMLVKQFCFVYWVDYCDGKEQGIAAIQQDMRALLGLVEKDGG
jgi:hypothetical protein